MCRRKKSIFLVHREKTQITSGKNPFPYYLFLSLLKKTACSSFHTIKSYWQAYKVQCSQWKVSYMLPLLGFCFLSCCTLFSRMPLCFLTEIPWGISRNSKDSGSKVNNPKALSLSVCFLYRSTKVKKEMHVGYFVHHYKIIQVLQVVYTTTATKTTTTSRKTGLVGDSD